MRGSALCVALAAAMCEIGLRKKRAAHTCAPHGARAQQCTEGEVHGVGVHHVCGPGAHDGHRAAQRVEHGVRDGVDQQQHLPNMGMAIR